MTNDDFGIIRVTYARKTDDELNKALDDSAKHFGGTFTQHEEETDCCIREYHFADETAGDMFIEQANFIISRHFPFELIDAADFPYRALWSFEEAVYHHVEFENIVAAQRFASWMRACFATYLEIEMFDVFIMNPVVSDGGPIVVYAFPKQSVLSDDMDEVEEIEDLLSSINVKKTDKGMLN